MPEIHVKKIPKEAHLFLSQPHLQAERVYLR